MKITLLQALIDQTTAARDNASAAVSMADHSARESARAMDLSARSMFKLNGILDKLEVEMAMAEMEREEC